MKRLLVKIDGVWEYVFCRNALKRNPITTKDKHLAIQEKAGDAKRVMAYFQGNYANHEFRLV